MSKALKGRLITEKHRIGMIETQSKLTKEEHHAVCDSWLTGMSLDQIAVQYNLAHSTISRYVNGATQKHWYADWQSSRNTNQLKQRRFRLKQNDVFLIFEMRQIGMTQKTIATRVSEVTGHNIGRTTIESILNGRSYRDYSQAWLNDREVSL